MLVLDLSVVNVALPAIRASLGLTPGMLEWVVNGYALAFGGFLLLGGRAADLFGGRRVFLAALSAFTLASLACGLSGGAVVLVTARVVEGLSAGVLSPATLSILTAVFTAPRARNRALSVWTAVAIGGGAVGAVAGGLLTGLLSWRWIFFINVPVGMVLLAAAALCLPRASSAGHGRLDFPGAVTVTGGLVAIAWALIRAQAAGWQSVQVAGALVTAAVLLGVFAAVETRVARAPLVPFAVFRSRLVSVGNALSFLSFAPVMAAWFFLTLYLQEVRGYSPVRTGLIFLPVSLAVAAGTQASFKVITRADARLLFLGGGAAAAAGMAWLAQLIPQGGLLWAVIVPACLTTAGGGLMFAPVTTAATSGRLPGQGGLASGLFNTSRQVGGALGLAILATIAAAHHGASHAALTAGFCAAFAAGAGIFAATAITGALILPGRIGTPQNGDPGHTRQPLPSRTADRQAADDHTSQP
jgi:EmrB/QacA subfamily drug resistance transporter